MIYMIMEVLFKKRKAKAFLFFKFRPLSSSLSIIFHLTFLQLYIALKSITTFLQLYMALKTITAFHSLDYFTIIFALAFTFSESFNFSFADPFFFATIVTIIFPFFTLTCLTVAISLIFAATFAFLA